MSEWTAWLREVMPFAGVLGLEVVRAEPDGVVATAPWSPDRCTAGGLLHGGALMASADSVAALCAQLNLPDGAGTSTIEAKTNFLGAVRDGVITVTATPLHVGRSTIVVQTDVHDDGGRQISRSLQTQAVLGG
ncbi:MAG: hotdog fold thioesterase [Pseudonocardiaceae bacterium]|nr:hotdog fold thioesterase [Pseudonocardiaceae bacterium]